MSRKGLPAPSLPLNAVSFAPPVLPWLFGGYVLLILLGVAVFRFPGWGMAPNREMDYGRAIFTSVNAATLTGFAQVVPATDYEPFGQRMLLLMTVAGSLFALIVGGWAVARVLGLPYRDGRIVRFALACEAGAMLLGMAVLLGDATGPLAGMTQAACAFGNSGLFLGGGRGRAAMPFAPTDWQLHAVVLPLAVLGGLGLTVLMELYDWFVGRKPLSRHARVVLGMSAGLYLVGLVGNVVLRGLDWAFAGGAEPFHWREAFALGSVLSLDARTLGQPLSGVAAPAASAMLPWFLLLLMAVGVSPGGTGGGLKTTTLAELWAGVGRALRGERAGRAFGIAAVWLLAYAAAAFVTLILLIPVYSDLHADRVVFLTVSALSNVGLSFDPIRPTVGGHLILSAAMLFGRIMPLVVAWWIAESAEEPAPLAVG